MLMSFLWVGIPIASRTCVIRILFPACVACAALSGQADVQGASRLLDCVERPYAYVRFHAPEAGAAKAVDGDASVRHVLCDRRNGGALRALLASDPRPWYAVVNFLARSSRTTCGRSSSSASALGCMS